MRLPQDVYERQADSKRVWLVDWGNQVSVDNQGRIIAITAPDAISLEDGVERGIQELWQRQLDSKRTDSFTVIMFGNDEFTNMKSLGMPYSIDTPRFDTREHAHGFSGFRSLHPINEGDFSVELPASVFSESVYSPVLLTTESTLVPTAFACLQSNKDKSYHHIARRDPILLGLTVDAKTPAAKYWKADLVMMLDIINGAVEELRDTFNRDNHISAFVGEKVIVGPHNRRVVLNFPDLTGSQDPFIVRDPLYAIFKRYLDSGVLPADARSQLQQYGLNSRPHQELLTAVAKNYCGTFKNFPLEDIQNPSLVFERAPTNYTYRSYGNNENSPMITLRGRRTLTEKPDISLTVDGVREPQTRLLEASF